MGCAYGIVLSTQYYTDYEYYPVKSIAEGEPSLPFFFFSEAKRAASVARQ